jgi:hypothetical protein
LQLRKNGLTSLGNTWFQKHSGSQLASKAFFTVSVISYQMAKKVVNAVNNEIQFFLRARAHATEVSCNSSGRASLVSDCYVMALCKGSISLALWSACWERQYGIKVYWGKTKQTHVFRNRVDCCRDTHLLHLCLLWLLLL